MVVEAVSIGNDLLPEKDTTFFPYLHGGGSIQAGEEEEAASPHSIPFHSVRKRWSGKEIRRIRYRRVSREETCKN